MRKKGSWGELEIIDTLTQVFGRMAEKFDDDVALVPDLASDQIVMSVDHLSEDVHFRRKSISPEDLGYKSLAVNLSDLASKGAEPIGSFLSWALPVDVGLDWVKNFSEGYRELSKASGCRLLGGDTGRSESGIFISVTVVGKLPGAAAKVRSGARKGDVIAVTGALGDSALGLEILESRPSGRHRIGEDFFIQKHQRPTPRLQEGAWLASQLGVHAMMDVSDGLWCDLPKMMTAAKKSAEVDCDSIPTSMESVNFATKRQVSVLKWSLFGGEDYELLCAAEPLTFDKLKRDFEKKFDLQLTRIGIVQGGHSGDIQWNSSVDLSQFKSFSHF